MNKLSVKITAFVLCAVLCLSGVITAPRAISIHIELMISISEYSATPKVAANSPIPETMMDGIEV